MFTFVMGFGIAGRFIGGALGYKFSYPAKVKFSLTVAACVCFSLVNGVLLFLPTQLMMAFNFISGISLVIANNIRTSATQSYLPDSRRARFNGAFQTLCALGLIFGQLFAGVLGDILPTREIYVGFVVINLASIFFTFIKGRNHVEPVYNREV
jgi:MFS family permease